MFRNFSDDARKQLIDYVDEVAPTTALEEILDVIEDIFTRCDFWLSKIGINNYMTDVSTYQKNIVDAYDYSVEKINTIFDDVIKTDSTYKVYIEKQVENVSNIVAMINAMADCIDPNAGNLSSSYEGYTVLGDASDAITASRATAAEKVEESMLGVAPEASEQSADPVNLSTGNFIYDHEDLSIGGEIPLSFHRYYNSKDKRFGSLGKCFLHNYDIAIEEKSNGEIGVRLSDGQFHHFEKTVEGKYIGKTIAVENLEKTEAGYSLVTPGKERKFFDLDGKLLRQENWFGRGTTFVYNESGLLSEAITDTNSKLIYSYDENNMLISVSDHTGRSVSLSYENNNLVKAIMPTGSVYTYAYEANSRITEVVNAREVKAVINEYDKKYRVINQIFPDGGTMSFEYDDANNRVIMTERNGVKTTHVHDDNYRNTETIYADGTTERYIYNEKNQCISKTDRNGHVTRMAYDNRGNVTQVVDALKKRTNFTYDANNHLIAISVNGKERIKNHYDASGRLIGTENHDGGNVWITYDEKAHPIEVLQADGSKISLAYDAHGNVKAITDAAGVVTAYEYDALNRITKSIDGNGNVASFEYDHANCIAKVTNPKGNSRVYEYNPSGRVTKVVDFDGYVLQISYNEVGKVSSITDKENNVTTYEYDKMWNLVSQTMPNSAVVSNSYDINNRLSEATLPLGGTIFYEYDAVGNKTRETDAEGNKTAFVYDAVNRLIEKIDADGAKTKFKYDREGNLITVTNAMGFETSYTYDDSGRRTSVTDAEGNTTSVCYNNMGNVERVCFPNGSQTVYTYEIGGRLQSVENPDGFKESFSYDNNGNLISRTNGVGDTIQFEYDKLNRIVGIINQLGGKRSFVYDAVGHVTEITDEKGNKTNYEYSPNGNLLKVRDALGNETFYEYDVMGNLIKTICTGGNGEESQLTSFDWDVEGHIISVTDPLGAVESYVYNKNGNMISKTDRDGYETKFTYGVSGKVEEILYADGQSVALSYDALRRLQKIKDMLGTTSITMDKMGRATSVTDSYGKTTGYEWGAMGEKTAVIYPDGKRADYEYNSAMQLVELHTGRDTIKYAYDEIGRIKQRILPNGVTTGYHYSAFGRVDEIKHEGVNVSESYKYEFDAYGNKISVKKYRPGVEVDNGIFSYVYDELSRLSEVYKNDTLLRKYNYDAFGNRTQKVDYTAGAETVTNYVYNINNQLLIESDNCITKTYNYDNRGNLIDVKLNDELLKAFTFDATNRMTASAGIVDGVQKNATYTYNGLGHRMEQNVYAGLIPENPEKKIQYTIDMTRQYYNLLQTNSGEAYARTYYWDGNVVGVESYGEAYFYLQDDLGSPMQLLNENGIGDESFVYDEFGLGLVDQPRNSQVFGFTGYQMDEVGGLYFAQARRYDAQTGRFVSEDKVRGGIVSPYTMNHYVYCWNNPILCVDFNGMEPELPANGETSRFFLDFNEKREETYKSLFSPINNGLENKGTYQSLFDKNSLEGINDTEIKNNSLEEKKNNKKGTFTIKLSGNATCIFGVAGDVGVSFDRYGNVALQGSYSVPGVDETVSTGVLAAGVTLAVSVTEAETVDGLLGPSSSVGGSGGLLGYGAVDIISFEDMSDMNSDMDGIQLGIGLGAGVDIHMTESYTREIWSVNIYDELNELMFNNFNDLCEDR